MMGELSRGRPSIMPLKNARRAERPVNGAIDITRLGSNNDLVRSGIDMVRRWIWGVNSFNCDCAQMPKYFENVRGWADP